MSQYWNGDRLVTTCDSCGLFCNPDKADWYTPYGCANPEDPEPFDPSTICVRCRPKFLDDWRKRFRLAATRGPFVVVSGDWQKSQSEHQAAEEAGYEWIGTAGNWVASSEQRRRLAKAPQVPGRYYGGSSSSWHPPWRELPLWRQNCWATRQERERLEATA